MAEQARTLIALRKADPAWRALLDRVALEADTELHDGAKYHQVGVDVGNGWQRQENGGLWGTDWFGRAQAAVIYIYVNDFHEALYFIRGTDAADAFSSAGTLHDDLRARRAAAGGLQGRGGFWSLTMYDQDYYMPADSPNGRHNIGTVNLDANELTFAQDGSLTLHLSHEPPTEPSGAGQLAPGAGRPVRADRARLRTNPAAARRHVHTAERAAAIGSLCEERSWQAIQRQDRTGYP